MRADGKKVAEIVCHTDREGLKPEYLATGDANARLIAAAPELLAACRALVERSQTIYTHSTNIEPAYVKQARAAIAKAEGN